jgi:transcriptional regulator with XRE-family HTH domain
MMTFREHLKEKLKDDRFRQLYEEERQLAELSLRILDAREQMGLSQKEVAKRAKITQQQLSKIENGVNCNMATFLKVCDALGLKLDLSGSEGIDLENSKTTWSVGQLKRNPRNR